MREREADTNEIRMKIEDAQDNAVIFGSGDHNAEKIREAFGSDIVQRGDELIIREFDDEEDARDEDEKRKELEKEAELEDIDFSEADDENEDEDGDVLLFEDEEEETDDKTDDKGDDLTDDEDFSDDDEDFNFGSLFEEVEDDGSDDEE